jgi:hypothetical protein
VPGGVVGIVVFWRSGVVGEEAEGESEKERG